MEVVCVFFDYNDIFKIVIFTHHCFILLSSVYIQFRGLVYANIPDDPLAEANETND